MKNTKLRWYIHKSSRPCFTTPYRGPSCSKAKTRPGHIYKNFKSAKRACDKLSKVNMVGFEVKQVDCKRRKT